VSLRPALAGDAQFLFALYASTREAERTLAGWDDGAWRSFLLQQLTAQREYYRAHYVGAEDFIIVVDGKDVGRFMQCRLADEMRFMDIAFLPEFRGRGFGTAVIMAMLEAAFEAGLPASFHVEKTNRAIRLYERLGFGIVADVGMHYRMERRPPSTVS
jgi:ribosomal protein S18 acetylase RimI-like enzyme